METTSLTIPSDLSALVSAEVAKMVGEFGLKVVFDETAEILRSDGLNRASPIVNDSGPAAELVPIVWSATAAIVGGG